MSARKSRFMLWLLAAACVGCCALPIYLMIGGAAAITATGAMLLPELREVLFCVLPLALIAVIIFLMRRKKKSCCDAPNSGCTEIQCGLNSEK